MTSWFAPYAWLGGPDLTRNVTVRVEDGTVHSVIESADPPTEGTHLSGVLIPGMVSAHSHAFHRALRGQTHAHGGDFWQWRTKMYAVATQLTPTSYERLATEVFAEMLRAGITTVGEFHYVHHQPNGVPYEDQHAMELAVIRAANNAGIRLTLLDACYLTSAIDGSKPLPEQQRFSDGSAQAWARRVTSLASMTHDATVKIGVAAHSVRAVPAADLETIAGTATALDAPLHVHVSEQRAENDACFTEHGVSPTRLLAERGALGPTTTAIHATHLTDDDMDRYAEFGAGVCFCPTTERDLGDGIGPARELRDRGIRISLGSDSNAVIDPFAEARALEMNDRLRLERRGIHSPENLLHSGTMAGLAALGWGDHAPLAPGSPADFISVDCPPDLGTLVLATDHHAVTDVVVAGRQVVSEGRSLAGHSDDALRNAISELT